MNQTDFLIVKPSFMNGAARVFDLGCGLPSYNQSETGEEADYRAILSDWLVIGKDIKAAINQFSNEQEK